MAYAKIWISNILTKLDSLFARLAIVASIIAYFGLNSANTPYANWLAYAALAALLFVIAIAKPPYVPPPNLTQPLSLEDLNERLASTPRVGLLGLRKVGKTTFLNATVARKSVKKETEKPYGQFVRIPDSTPAKSIVIIDSVGARDHVQFLVQGMSNKIIMMIDHSESDTENAHDQQRLDDHFDLADQLAHTARDNGIIVDRVVIVATKSDLWTQNDVTKAKVVELTERIRRRFAEESSYRSVSVIEQYSNESRADVAELLRLSSEE